MNASLTAQPASKFSWKIVWAVLAFVALITAASLFCLHREPVLYDIGSREELLRPRPINAFVVMHWACLGLLFMPGIFIGYARIRGWALIGCLVAYGAGCVLGWCIGELHVVLRDITRPDLWPLLSPPFYGGFCIRVLVGAMAIGLGYLVRLGAVTIHRRRLGH